MLRILLAEDDSIVREASARALRAAGHEVLEVADGAAAAKEVSGRVFDLVISDVRMPKLDGLLLFRRVRETAKGTDVILMTSFGSVSDAVGALKEGAHDYLTKPFALEELVLRVAAIDRARAIAAELADARARLAGDSDVDIVGGSPAIVKLLDRLDAVADSDASVLVTGESGTGKELVARRIHVRGARRARPFVAVNCAAFPETLLEAELFGHERGAFTGAIRRRPGRFQTADSGTLFLDEVGEIPIPAQAKLLRVLEEGMVEPLGADDPVHVDVRVLAATHRDLKKAITEGRFREDLYYRLNVVTLHVPPLRERMGDLPLLVSHFLGRFTPPGSVPPTISVKAWQALSNFPFPGNVRELGHAIQHAVVLARGKPIDVEHLPEDIVGVASSAEGKGTLLPLATVVQRAERAHLILALAVAKGKRAQAAQLIGISRKNLWEKLRAHGIDDSDIEDPP
jgi:two-component system response regulator AtoC